MNEIKLSVEDKNIETVLTILENLKEGLITKIESNSPLKKRTPHYKPTVNKIIKEEESGTNDRSGKYSSAAAYKQRLKNTKVATK